MGFCCCGPIEPFSKTLKVEDSLTDANEVHCRATSMLLPTCLWDMPLAGRPPPP